MGDKLYLAGMSGVTGLVKNSTTLPSSGDASIEPTKWALIVGFLLEVTCFELIPVMGPKGPIVVAISIGIGPL